MADGEQSRDLAAIPQHSGSVARVPEDAGEVIRGQVTAILDAARQSARETVDAATAGAGETTAEARRQAQQMLAYMEATERKLQEMRQTATRETDLLRSSLGAAPSSSQAPALTRSSPPEPEAAAVAADEPEPRARARH